MNFIDAIILGLVEGITEFLPVSSTGHLILASRLLSLPQSEFVKSFEIAIQVGGIMAVVVLYGRTLLIKKEVIKKVLTAFLPTAVIGLVFYKLVKTYFLGNDSVVLLSLFFGGICLILFEWWYKEKDSAAKSISEISYKQAFFIGLFQAIAIIPGVSRSAATIIGGLFLNLKRQTVVEFSFLLAIPTLAAAAGLDLIKTPASFSATEVSLFLVGFFVSFAVALAAISFLLQFVKNNSFVSFGIYRIFAAIIFWLFIL